uniref:Ephrin RBD domain-containing protein n=1 Tax=Ursus americanus TaxID=9643 RepID=A0A452QH64_URSAM
MGTTVPSPLNTCKSPPPSLDSVSQELSGWEPQALLSCSLSGGWGRGRRGPPSPPRELPRDGLVELDLNDYLDIFCPHYEGPGPPDGPETFALYMVDRPGYEACQAQGPGAFKRWECALPFAPFGPVRFSEKIQRFTPFSLGGHTPCRGDGAPYHCHGLGREPEVWGREGSGNEGVQVGFSAVASAPPFIFAGASTVPLYAGPRKWHLQGSIPQSLS